MKNNRDRFTNSDFSSNSLNETALYSEKEKTLRAAWLISFLGPVITAYTFYISGSTVLLINLIRRTIELITLIFNWAVFRSVHIHLNPTFQKWEPRSGILVAIILAFSVIGVIYTSIDRLYDPPVLDNLLPGLILSLIGIFVNAWFWRKKNKLVQQKSTPILEAQWRLYRSKTIMDVVTVISLTGTIYLQDYELGRYIDPAASVLLAGFLIHSAVVVFKSAYLGEK